MAASLARTGDQHLTDRHPDHLHRPDLQVGHHTLVRQHSPNSCDIGPSKDGIPCPGPRAHRSAEPCAHLTATNTRYSGTELLLRYEVKNRTWPRDW